MIQIGPASLSLERFYVLVALVVFIIIAEILAKLKSDTLSNWASNSMIIVLLFSRIGFVIENIGSFAKSPLSALRFWEGGFSPWWGVGAAILYSAWYFRKEKEAAKWALVPSLVALVLWSGLNFTNNSQQQKIVTLPEIQLAELSADSMNLSELTSRPVLINLWATWCGPCKREMPMLAEVASQNQDVQFIFINQGENASNVSSYLESNGIVLEHVLLDPQGQVADYFNSRGLPTTLFFNSQGELVSSSFGQISKVVLENKLEQIR